MAEQKVLFDVTLEYLGKNDKNRSNKSDKFYQIVVTIDGYAQYIQTRTWGKYGTKGQTKVLKFSEEWAACSSASKQLKKKRKKGYTDPVNALTRLATAAD